MQVGDPFHGEVTSADASGGVAATLYKAGDTDAHTLLATEFVAITDILFGSTAGGAYAVVADTDAAGLRIAKGNVAATIMVTHHFETPITCPKGVVPKLIADIGQADLIISGYISR